MTDFLQLASHAWTVLDKQRGDEDTLLRLVVHPCHELRAADQDVDRELRRALDRLTMLEIAAQCEPLKIPVHEHTGLSELFRSEVFVRYLNRYHYFAVRFLADRFLGDLDLEPPPKSAHSNMRPRALPTPPPPDSPASDSIMQWFGDLQVTARLNFRDAFDFLDEHLPDPNQGDGTDEKTRYRLMLRHLRPPAKGEEKFAKITGGLIDWIKTRVDFYKNFTKQKDLDQHFTKRKDHDWILTDPLCARFGLADFHWLARLLGADVSSTGIITYSERSWLRDVFAFRQSSDDSIKEDDIRMCEQILQGVFDYTCDLIQNAVEIREAQFARHNDPDQTPEKPVLVVDWREAFDEELDEIERERKERQTGQMAERRKKPPSTKGGPTHEHWSEKFRSELSVPNLVGLAFSGGGIRSATFGLGILQGLKDLDYLRHIDYVSTVSGGGFVGSWLLANVRRSAFWLTRLSNWEESITHLRKYSNYLAPRTGLMSADSWTMWGIWARNAFLIQLTALAWLSSILVLARTFKPVYVFIGFQQVLGHRIVWFGIALLAASIFSNFFWKPWKEKTILWFIVWPAWAGSFVTSALLWNEVTSGPLKPYGEYAKILQHAFQAWSGTLVWLFVAFAVISFSSVIPNQGAPVWRRYTNAIFSALLPMGVAYLALCGVTYIFHDWFTGKNQNEAEWYAYVFGPVLVLAALTISIVILIGLTGNLAKDGRREWWTRYGSWLGIYGVIFLAAGVGSVFGPQLIFWLVSLSPTWKWGAIGSWILSTAGGLLSGNSAKSKGGAAADRTGVSIEWIAKGAGVVFIAGAVLLSSALVHILLVNIWTNREPTSYDINYWPALSDPLPWQLLISSVVLVLCALLFSWRFDLNTFGLNHFYRNRLVRCYLGASRWRAGMRKPDRFTGFDDDDDLSLSDLRCEMRTEEYDQRPFRGPFPIVNCSLNLGGSSDLRLHTRQSASFTLTPWRCGSDRPSVGYAPTWSLTGSFAGGVSLGEAISISGAAASPNMGYHTSPIVSLLLTLFNVRLGWWYPNPGKAAWQEESLRLRESLLFQELFGLANEDQTYLNVSDGGHFENLAIYELVRRRAKLIIASDAECDSDLKFGSLGNLIRICETDFGARIDLNVDSLRLRDDSQKSAAHCAVGKIYYSNGSVGYLIYLKATLVGEEDPAILQYQAEHADFPHETTADQFFAEDQFESYRRLGHHIALRAFRGTEEAGHPIAAAKEMFDLWAPTGSGADAFVKHTEAVAKIWERLGKSQDLQELQNELRGFPANPLAAPEPTPAEFFACMEMIQLMENVFLEVRLDDFWNHPDNRGWALTFQAWAKSPKFRAVWEKTRDTYGIRFEYFCDRRLGLGRSKPAVRAG